MSARSVIHKAIKKHAGLSDFDDDGIRYEVKAILRALKRSGYSLVKVSS